MIKKLLVLNLWNLVSYSAAIFIASATNDYLYGLNHSVFDILSILLHSIEDMLFGMIYTTVFWVPIFIVLLILDYLFFFESLLNAAIAIIIEWFIVCAPLLYLLIDDFNIESAQRWIMYPIMIVCLLIGQIVKLKYLLKKYPELLTKN